MRFGCERGPGAIRRERRADVRPANRLRQQPHGATVLQNLIGKGVHRRFGNPGVELGDDRHTLPPFFFIALPPGVRPNVTQGLER